jgi:predicted RND superfamily exporter protein
MTLTKLLNLSLAITLLIASPQLAASAINESNITTTTHTKEQTTAKAFQNEIRKEMGKGIILLTHFTEKRPKIQTFSLQALAQANESTMNESLTLLKELKSILNTVKQIPPPPGGETLHQAALENMSFSITFLQETLIDLNAFMKTKPSTDQIHKKEQEIKQKSALLRVKDDELNKAHQAFSKKFELNIDHPTQ